MKLKILTFAVTLTLATNLSAQTFTTLHSFAAVTNGFGPLAGLILSGNTLYGTASGGGSSGNGTVFAINTDGTDFTNLLSVSFGTGPYGLVLLDNTLYWTTVGGGFEFDGTVSAVTTNGTGYRGLLNFVGNNGSFPYDSLIVSGNTLYGTTSGQGGYQPNYGTIFRINNDGTDFTNLYTFPAGGSNGSATIDSCIIK